MSASRNSRLVPLLVCFCLAGWHTPAFGDDVADAKAIVGKWSHEHAFIDKNGNKGVTKSLAEYRSDGTFEQASGFMGFSGIWKISAGKLKKKTTKGLFVPEGGVAFDDYSYRLTGDQLEIQRITPPAAARPTVWTRVAGGSVQAQDPLFWPDDTKVVISIDVAKTLGSKPVQQLLNGRSLVQFLKEAGSKDSEIFAKLITCTRSITFLGAGAAANDFVGFPRFHAVWHGKYDAEALRQLKEAARDGNLSLSWGVIDDTVLLTAPERDIVEATLVRAQKKVKPKLHEGLRAALQSLPKDRAVVVAGATFQPGPDDPLWATGGLNLTEKGVELELTVSLASNEAAKKFATQFRESSQQQVEQNVKLKPLAKELQAMAVQVLDKRVTLAVTLTTETLLQLQASGDALSPKR
jgi:hypothetical protein